MDRRALPATGAARSNHRLCGFALAAIMLGAVSALSGQVVVGPEVPLSNANITALGLGAVSVARAANGRSLAVWSDDRTGDHDVYGSLLSPNGARLTPLGGFRIAGSPGTNEGDPRVCACGNTFLVVWGNGVNDGDTTDLFATRVGTAGVVLDAIPIVISDEPGVQQGQRKHASDGVDTFLVPFRTQAHVGNVGGINTMRVSASTGMTLDSPGGAVLALADPVEGLKKNPSASFGAGQFFVTWDDQRDGCQYPGESGCIDIYGAFVDPVTGGLIGAPFPTTRAFSCQEGSRSDFDGTNFFVCHNDERNTNCSTSDVTGERVTPGGVVLDPVDPTGMIGGLWIASDPPAYPGSGQGASTVLAAPCARLVTYADLAVAPPLVTLRMKRLDREGQHDYGVSPALPGLLIAQGLPSPGASTRVESCVLGPHAYLLAYALNNVPATRVARFTLPMERLIVGPGPFTFKAPRGVAVDSLGNIYVADSGNHRIQVFNSDGQFLLGFGTYGSGNGQFKDPFGVAVDAAGGIYVADSNNNRVQVFNGNGQFLFKFGSLGAGDGSFRSPFGIAVDVAGTIYVADTDNHRVQVFTNNGQFLFKFGTLGTGNGQFRAARAIAVDAAGMIYVADRDNNRIQVFNANGLFVRKFSGGFSAPRGVAVDRDGKTYVADSLNNRVAVFNALGQFHYSFGSFGAKPGAFNFVPAVAVGGDGDIYVVDSYNNRVQVFGCVP